jgi:diacylglycerol kinase family enzyme
VPSAEPSSKLLIVNPGAGSVTDEVKERLDAEFPDYQVVDFPPDKDLIKGLRGQALIVACGGDGTIAEVARLLAGTGHAFGVLPLGTFNNFARSLDIPTDLDAAIEVIKHGHARPATVGSVNGRLFLEAAAIGFFGDSLALGEAAKDLRYGELVDRLAAVASNRRFHFRVTGDVDVSGEAVSIIVANTPSIGARMPVAESTPVEPYLDLVIDPGSKLGLTARLVAAAVRGEPPEGFEAHRIRHVQIATDPRLDVHADVHDAGSTPAVVEAMAKGLLVIMP